MGLATDTRSIPLLEEGKEYIFLLEDLELAIEKNQLNRIVEYHNAGMDFRDIAKRERKMPEEVFLALFHAGIDTTRRKGMKKINRPLAYIRRKI